MLKLDVFTSSKDQSDSPGNQSFKYFCITAHYGIFTYYRYNLSSSLEACWTFHGPEVKVGHLKPLTLALKALIVSIKGFKGSALTFNFDSKHEWTLFRSPRGVEGAPIELITRCQTGGVSSRVPSAFASVPPLTRPATCQTNCEARSNLCFCAC